ncbi:hypothetical protein BH11PSE13_BH11PSE13_12400 [soil metagenome]
MPTRFKPLAALTASIKRHAPFLTPADKALLGATTAEQTSARRIREIAASMGVRLPGQPR